MIDANQIFLTLKASLYPELQWTDFQSQLSASCLDSRVLLFKKIKANTIKRKGFMGKERTRRKWYTR